MTAGSVISLPNSHKEAVLGPEEKIVAKDSTPATNTDKTKRQSVLDVFDEIERSAYRRRLDNCATSNKHWQSQRS